MSTLKPTVLCILDGWGLRDDPTANAPALAKTPVFDRIMADCPNATLITHGPDVGLPVGQMGNSEVGHTNIGAGRVVSMDLGQIDLAIENGSYEQNQVLRKFIKALKISGGTAHLMILLSDGGVHSHISHLLATINILAATGIKVVVHAITDGRDVSQKSAGGYLDLLENSLPENAGIGTVIGRYFALDRDNRWDRVARAYYCMSKAQGLSANTARQALKDAYDRGETDEFVQPTIIGGYQGWLDGDGLFCLNFRSDRAREILAAIGKPGFDAFETGPRKDLILLGMVEYSDDHSTYMDAVFPKRKLVNTLGEWVSKKGRTQFRLAETEKYPHVTFFLNGGKEQPEPGEDRFMPASPKVATYDLQPEMSAPEVTDKFVGAIEKGYDLIVVNYANPDMVGHTGDLNAAILAVEAVDQGLGRVVAALGKSGGAMVLTADHGNCETMIDPETGEPHGAHTTNLVPVAVCGAPDGTKLRSGRLADLAPTLLELMGLPQPAEMTGQSLLTR